jgi:Zn-dependent oligopeptidase
MNTNGTRIHQNSFRPSLKSAADKRAGMKTRHEIYEPGDPHDVTMSIQKFVGRKQSIEPFLRKLGIRPQR